MAERRSFSSLIVEDDKFYALSLQAQVLYFHICMQAKDKGVLNNVFTIAKCLGCTNEHVKELYDNDFIKPILDSEFQSEWEIVHWYENNGIGETAKKRNNYKYRQWRQMVIARDGKCVFCSSEDNLQAHHIKSFAQFPSLRFDIENGITLCKDCHNNYHRKEREHGRS